MNTTDSSYIGAHISTLRQGRRPTNGAAYVHVSESFVSGSLYFVHITSHGNHFRFCAAMFPAHCAASAHPRYTAPTGCSSTRCRQQPSSVLSTDSAILQLGHGWHKRATIQGHFAGCAQDTNDCGDEARGTSDPAT
jgi:hypothetical protein